MLLDHDGRSSDLLGDKADRFSDQEERGNIGVARVVEGSLPYLQGFEAHSPDPFLEIGLVYRMAADEFIVPPQMPFGQKDEVVRIALVRELRAEDLNRLGEEAEVILAKFPRRRGEWEYLEDLA